MMDNDNLSGPKQLLRDDDGTEGLDCATTGISNYMRVTLSQSESFRRIKSRIHACDNDNLAKEFE